MLGTKLMADTPLTVSTSAMRRAAARRTATVLGVIAILVFLASILNAMNVI